MSIFKQAIALVGILAVALAMAAAAGAVDDDPVDDPQLPPDKPNLVLTAASIVPFGASEWEIRYTVANKGALATPSFRVSVLQNGSSLIKSTAHAALSPGTSRSETIHVSRASCYIPVQFVADSTHVVAESNEFDNVHWAVGLTSPACSAQPRYKVKAVSFKAVDESGTDWLGSDEPYAIFNAVGVDGTQTSSVSHVFGDIDTGDIGVFSAAEGCLYISCSGGTAPFGMGFSIQLWEHDLGEIPRIFNSTVVWFYDAGAMLNLLSGTSWAGYAFVNMSEGLNDMLTHIWADHPLGGQTYAYTPAYLASRLTAAGGTFNDTRTYTDGDAVYTLTTAVMRTF
jgi:hypothetical protein